MYGNIKTYWEYAEYVWKFIKDIGDMYGNIKKHQEYVWTSKEI